METGFGKALFIATVYYAQPKLKGIMLPANRSAHWGKVAFEKYWFSNWF